MITLPIPLVPLVPPRMPNVAYSFPITIGNSQVPLGKDVVPLMLILLSFSLSIGSLVSSLLSLAPPPLLSIALLPRILCSLTFLTRFYVILSLSHLSCII